MSYRKINTWLTVDWLTIGLYLIMVVAGWFSIYAATYSYEHTGLFNMSERARMQMLWIGTSLALAFIILMIDSDWYEIFSTFIYMIIIFLLILTIFLATNTRGSHSWLQIGGFRLQPAEFAKFATALAVAKLMNGVNFKLMASSNLYKTLGLIFLPAALIILQKETGSALVFLAFFIVLYREGMPGFVLFSGFFAILVFILSIYFGNVFIINDVTDAGEFSVLLLIILVMLFLVYTYKKGKEILKYMAPIIGGLLLVACIVAMYVPQLNLSWALDGIIAAMILFFLLFYLKFRAKRYLLIITFAFISSLFLYSVDYVFDNILEPHQRVRIQVTLGMIDDPKGAGFNVNQSKIAIGSGGLLGKGYLNGTQTKLQYVPEQDTDFIFCTIGEEKGFAGSLVVVALFVTLTLRLLYLAERQKSSFNRIYGYSVASIIFFHFLVNIGMVTGITPVIGIPLPFFSYGGSSIWGFTILLFIFLRLDAGRNARL